ncbi:hypothetical protein VC4260B_11210 [Vibrio cholerae 4260B]|nr:hypothetical protein ASZ80_01481 [Vibrio cholerae]EEO07606.1 hypothetical protein VIF_000762 [Vibrio cholerae TM 11079-80]EEY46680.1 hypothetical protein VIG_003366 [Vibrio cholerae INDRE 91/1]EJH65592.1 hypothetical protein VCHE45_0528 [Vibrio cholerae HE-45]ELP50902.1 hypothetical protein VC4260B_11210 [Vibrio cholerae 4260B]EMP89721.1 hypothetical protein VC116063_000252 [Vibrio cholerae O1 str. 116063]EMQ49672.1 hypothetical protein VCPCS023_000246 [Vibrio cholerae O1 str. PCS-023]
MERQYVLVKPFCNDALVLGSLLNQEFSLALLLGIGSALHPDL